jgi:DNA repair exonuclease SbcCD nuclease subunit
VELKIFLTADVHLGMKFAQYPEAQKELSEVRFDTLHGLVDRANGEGCNLFLVAGDLFDRVSVPKETILRAAAILGEFQGELTAVLPGNHDFCAPGSDRLWAEFGSRSGDRTLVLTEKRPYPLDHYNLDAALYPAPCEGKHSERNAVGWVRESPEGAFRVGVAHGSLMGVSPDFDQRYYPMTREELESAGLDVWLLGHTHVRYPFNPDSTDRIFYPGTPEPDGFDCEHGGSAWIITLKGESSAGGPAPRAARLRAALNAKPVSTGRYRFLRRSVEIEGASDLDSLGRAFSSGEHAKTLLKLSLRGRIPREYGRSVASLEEEIARAVFFLHRPVDVSELREEITSEDIAREFTEHSFPHRLLTALSAAGDHEALQIAYEKIRESRR